MRVRVRCLETGESFSDITELYVKLVNELKERGL